MAKVLLKTPKIFAKDAVNKGVIGSGQTGAKDTSSDLTVLQSLAAFFNGFNDIVLSGRRLVPLEELNSLNFIHTYQAFYQRQEGIPEYDAAMNYQTYSIVKKVGTVQLYKSLIDDNIGQALTDDTKWKFLIDLNDTSTPVFFARDEKASGTFGGTAATGSGTLRTINTVKKNTIAGASLLANVITLPVGVYDIDASAPAQSVGYHKLSLLNNATVAIIEHGTSEFSSAAAQYSQSRSVVRVRGLVVAAPITLNLTHWTAAGTATLGLGQATSNGNPEVYSEIEIRKVG